MERLDKERFEKNPSLFLEQAIKERMVRTVVSTTGITSGMSLPFDCVVILLDPNMYFLTTRSRYLQIAGRIGEYHLD